MRLEDRLKMREINHTLFIYFNIMNGYTIQFLEILNGMQYCMMFNVTGDDVFDLVLFNSADDGSIICFGTAGSKKKFSGSGVQQVGNFFTCNFNGRSRFATVPVNG